MESISSTNNAKDEKPKAFVKKIKFPDAPPLKKVDFDKLDQDIQRNIIDYFNYRFRKGKM